MRRTPSIPVLCLMGFIAAFFACYMHAEAVPTLSAKERNARWQQDIKFFVSNFRNSYKLELRHGVFRRGQKDFAALYPPSEFNSAVARLRSDVPNLSDDEIVLRLMRLVAGAHVAHNTVVPKGKGFSLRLPLGFTWFSDGLAVTSAAAEYAEAEGARVVQIGGLTPDQLVSSLEPYISHENDIWLRRRAQALFGREAVLRHFGLIGSDGRVSIRLEKPGLPQFTISVAPAEPSTELIPFAEALHVPKPLSLNHQESSYWYQYLEDAGTLYIQYNKCANDPNLAFTEFTRQVLAEADHRRIKRVVIDLRQNGGGNSVIIDPLKAGLAERSKSIGHIYVLIGAGTFSSGVMNAFDLRRELNATLVGESTGGTPGGYGEINLISLPNSGVVVTFTSKHFGRYFGTNDSTLKPDIVVPRSLADALAGRDPVLEAALAAF